MHRSLFGVYWVIEGIYQISILNEISIGENDAKLPDYIITLISKLQNKLPKNT